MFNSVYWDVCNSSLHGSWKVTKLLHETEAKVVLAQFREVEIIIIRKKLVPTSPSFPGQPSPRFHVEAWLPFRNREMDYCLPT